MNAYLFNRNIQLEQKTTFFKNVNENNYLFYFPRSDTTHNVQMNLGIMNENVYQPFLEDSMGARTPRAASLDASRGTNHHVSFTGDILVNVNKHFPTTEQHDLFRFATATLWDQQQTYKMEKISQKTGERLGVV